MKRSMSPPDTRPDVCWVEGSEYFWAETAPDFEAAFRLERIATRFEVYAEDGGVITHKDAAEWRELVRRALGQWYASANTSA